MNLEIKRERKKKRLIGSVNFWSARGAFRHRTTAQPIVTSVSPIHTVNEWFLLSPFYVVYGVEDALAMKGGAGGGRGGCFGLTIH